MQNLPAQSVCFRNNTPNHTLTDLKARQSSKIREIGNALITAAGRQLFVSAVRIGKVRSPSDDARSREVRTLPL